MSLTVSGLLLGLIGWMGFDLFLHGWPHVQRNPSPHLSGMVILGIAVLGLGWTWWAWYPMIRVLRKREATKEDAS